MNLKWPDAELGRRQAAAALLCGGPILVCLQPAERESERVTPTLPREREIEVWFGQNTAVPVFVIYLYILSRFYALLLLNLSKYFEVIYVSLINEHRVEGLAILMFAVFTLNMCIYFTYLAFKIVF